jgi:hypothetical protein
LPVIGRVTRHGGLVGRSLVDPFFEQFLSEKRVDIPPDFVRVVPDEEAEEMAVNKYSQTPIVESLDTRECMLLAEDWIVHELLPYCTSKISSLDEVLEYLDLTKNPGGLWLNSYSTKYECLTDPHFDDWFRTVYFPSQFTDEPVLTFTTWFMKTEMRAYEKAFTNALRSISGKSVEHVVAMNVFDLNFNRDFVKYGGHGWSALGVPLVRSGWNHHILQRLDRHPNSFEVDGRLWDSTFHRSTFDRVQSVRVRLFRCVGFTPHLAEWATMCESLRDLETLQARDPDSVHTRTMRAWHNLYLQKMGGPQILSDGTVLWKDYGNDSGQCSTIVDNTLGSKVRLCACFISLFRAKHDRFPLLSEFNRFVSDLHLGDDANFSVSNDIVDWFNAETYALWCRNALGVIMTTPCVEPRPAKDVEFLSQKTVYTRGYPLPQLNGQKMLCSLRWGNEHAGDLTLTLQRALQFRMILFTDVERFKFVDEFVHWLLLRYGHVMSGSPEWEACLHAYFTPGELTNLWISRFESVSLPSVLKQSMPPKTENASGKRIANREKVRKTSRPHNNSASAKGALRAGGNESLIGPSGGALAIGEAIAEAIKPKTKAKSKKNKENKNPKSKQLEKVVSILRNGRSRGTFKTIRPGCVSSGYHRELILDFANTSTAGNFTILKTFPLNPGNSELFPMAHQNADLFEKYRFKYLAFEYIPAVNLMNSSGVVGMYADYDPDSAGVTSIAAASANETSSLEAVYDPQYLEVRCDKTWRFQKQASTDTTDANARFEYLGDLRIYCDKVVTVAALGYLWVHYEIEYKDSKPPASVALSSIRTAFAVPHTTANVDVGVSPVDTQNVNYVNHGMDTVDAANEAFHDFIPTNTGNYVVSMWCSTTEAVAGVGTESFALVARQNPSVAVASVAWVGSASAVTHTFSAIVALTGGLTYGFNIKSTQSGQTTTFVYLKLTCTAQNQFQYGKSLLALPSPPVFRSFHLPEDVAMLAEWIVGLEGSMNCAFTPDEDEKDDDFIRELDRLKHAYESRGRSRTACLPPFRPRVAHPPPSDDLVYKGFNIPRRLVDEKDTSEKPDVFTLLCHQLLDDHLISHREWVEVMAKSPDGFKALQSLSQNLADGELRDPRIMQLLTGFPPSVLGADWDRISLDLQSPRVQRVVQEDEKSSTSKRANSRGPALKQ